MSSIRSSYPARTQRSGTRNSAKRYLYSKRVLGFESSTSTGLRPKYEYEQDQEDDEEGWNAESRQLDSLKTARCSMREVEVYKLLLGN